MAFRFNFHISPLVCARNDKASPFGIKTDIVDNMKWRHFIREHLMTSEINVKDNVKSAENLRFEKQTV